MVVLVNVVVVIVVVVVLSMQVPHSTGQLSVIDWLKTVSPHLSSVMWIWSQISGSGLPLQTGGMHVPHNAGHSSLISMPVLTDSFPHCVSSKSPHSSTSGTP